MTKLRIPNNALTIVADGRKALFLRNMGGKGRPNLQVMRAVEDEPHPRTAELGTDKPGRTFDRATQRRSAVGQTDWHTLAEEKFARDIVGLLEPMDRAVRFNGFVLVAPPRTLAEIRTALPASLKDRVLAEIDKDLTNHPLSEIERILTEA